MCPRAPRRPAPSTTRSRGVIKDAFWLRLYWRFNLAGTPLHTGEYRMPRHDRQGLIDLWKRGEVVQYSLTLVEGWNFHQVRAAWPRMKRSSTPWTA
jgi:UPF0755 protein